jgi:hypothetical protein
VSQRSSVNDRQPLNFMGRLRRFSSRFRSSSTANNAVRVARRATATKSQPRPELSRFLHFTPEADTDLQLTGRRAKKIGTDKLQQHRTRTGVFLIESKELMHSGSHEGTIMNYYGRAQAVAEQIVEAFQSGNIPIALAPVFVHRKDGVPCRT